MDLFRVQKLFKNTCYDPEKAAMTACGKGFSLVIDQDGAVRGMGCNYQGQLGWPYTHSMLSHDQWLSLETRTMLTASLPVVMQETRALRAVLVAACHETSCVILSDGSVLVSIGGCWPRALMKRKNFSSPVVSVACGLQHLVAVTLQGRVHTCGARSFGQCGRGPAHAASAEHPSSAEYTTFGLVESDDTFNATVFVFASAGHRNSSCVGNDGSVWSFGNGTCGVNGCGDTLKYSHPTRIHADCFENRHVVMTAVGQAHAAAVTTDGAVFTWGDSEYGQLGHGNIQPQHTPQRVEALQHNAVRTIACGCRHTIAATESGDCWQWGTITDLRPGMPYSRANFGWPFEKLLKPFLFPPLADGAAVVAVAAGATHSAVVTQNGRLFVWGIGNGMGGHDEHSRSVVIDPFHVEFPKRIGRWQNGVSTEHLEAFVMSTHTRLGANCVQLASDVVRQICTLCTWRPEGPGPQLEGVKRLMGAGDRV